MFFTNGVWPRKYDPAIKKSKLNFVVEYPIWVSIKRTLTGKLAVGGRNFIDQVIFSRPNTVGEKDEFQFETSGVFYLYLDTIKSKEAKSLWPERHTCDICCIFLQLVLNAPSLCSRQAHPIWHPYHII